MASNEELIREFEDTRKRYYELYAKLVAAKVPGVIDKVGLTCNCGESCHGGSPDLPIGRITFPVNK
jgi:hypothetical protein